MCSFCFVSEFFVKDFKQTTTTTTTTTTTLFIHIYNYNRDLYYVQQVVIMYSKMLSNNQS